MYSRGIHCVVVTVIFSLLHTGLSPSSVLCLQSCIWLRQHQEAEVIGTLYNMYTYPVSITVVICIYIHIMRIHGHCCRVSDKVLTN